MANVFDDLYHLKQRLDRATMRCERIAESERILGYAESSRLYLDLSDEIKASYGWLNDLMVKSLNLDPQMIGY